ncbi:MAG TPA: hypothetical protein VMQ76_13095 [Terracidiphilus sp.]|nr:hypothetical protein [Terracidiphilus sp.]
MIDPEQVSLREFIERIMDEREKALGLATMNLEKRLDLLNELRGDVLTKAEWNATHYPLADRVTKLENWQAKIVGGGLLLMAVSGALGAVIAYLARLK